MNNWVKVYSNSQYFKSEMVKQVLIDHEIEAVIMNKQDSSYKFGMVEVHVEESNEERAKQIIEENNL